MSAKFVRWTVLGMGLVGLLASAPAYAGEDRPAPKKVEDKAEPVVKTKTESAFVVNGRKFKIKIVDGKPMVLVEGNANVSLFVPSDEAEPVKPKLVVLKDHEVFLKDGTKVWRGKRTPAATDKNGGLVFRADEEEDDGHDQRKNLAHVIERAMEFIHKHAEGMDEQSMANMLAALIKSDMLKHIVDKVDVSVRVDGEDHDAAPHGLAKRVKRLEVQNRRLLKELGRMRKRLNEISGHTKDARKPQPRAKRVRVLPATDVWKPARGKRGLDIGDRLERIETMLERLVAMRSGGSLRIQGARTQQSTDRRMRRRKRTDTEFMADMAKRKAKHAAERKAGHRGMLEKGYRQKAKSKSQDLAVQLAKAQEARRKAMAKSKKISEHNRRLKTSYERLNEVMLKLEEQRKKLEEQKAAR